MKLPLAHISVFANFLQKSLNDTTEGDPEFAELQKWHNKVLILSSFIPSLLFVFNKSNFFLTVDRVAESDDSERGIYGLTCPTF